MATSAAHKIDRLPATGEGQRLAILATKACFLLMILSMMFETLGAGSDSTPLYFTVSRGIGYVLVLFAMVCPGFSMRRVPGVLLCFAIYPMVLYAHYWTDPAWNQTAFLLSFGSAVQLVFFFWIAYNICANGMVKLAMNTFAISAALAGWLWFSGAASGYWEGNLARATILYEDPNNAGSMLALGFVAVLGAAMNATIQNKLIRLALFISILPIGAALLATGSRGAMLGAGIGIVVLLFAQPSRSVMTSPVMRLAVLAVIFVVAIGSILSNSELVSRWNLTIEQHNLSGRQTIYLSALRLVEERPLYGWGTVTLFDKLGMQLGRSRVDTHNTELVVLGETGLLGFLPFAAGVLFCIREAWVHRRSLLGATPLALMGTLMVTASSITWIQRKQFWLVLILAATARFAYMIEDKEEEPDHLQPLEAPASRPS